MRVTRVLLARHGETDWNRHGRWQGQTGPGLNDLGRRQADALADRLARGERIDAIYTSDLSRTVETAQIVAERLGIPPVPESALREVDVGSWAGLSREEVRASDADGYARWLNGQSGWEGGETYDELHARSVEAVMRLVERHPDGTILAVTHGGVVRAVAAHAVGLERHDRRRIIGAANCSLTIVQMGMDGRLSLVAFNDTGHLPTEPVADDHRRE
jgi:broad specificity phosphatase PhoE